MAKKMFDILPPKMAQKTDLSARGLPVRGSTQTGAQAGKTAKKPPTGAKRRKTPTAPVATAPAREIKAPKREKRSLLGKIFAGSAVILFLLAIYGVTKLPMATVEIWPKQDTLVLSQKITADRSATAINSKNNVIPARYLEEIKEASQEFEATGSASNEGKAAGTIKIYNKTNSVFALVKGTHFLSDSGKYFVTLARISVPAAKGNSPGSIDAQVQAEESGSSHNIGPSKFSVPKLYGTAFYHSIYGESNSSMAGGYTGNVKKVTSDDLSQAKDALTKKLLEEATASLRNQVGADEILLESAIETTVIESIFDAKADAIADNFNGKAKVKAFALVFKKQEAEQLVKENVVATLEKNTDFLRESLHVDYTPEVVDSKGGKLALNLQSSVQTYYNINTNDLTELFPMKSGEQIKEVIDQMYEDKVAELKIDFWPFWVHKAPGDKDRIKTKLMFGVKES